MTEVYPKIVSILGLLRPFIARLPLLIFKELSDTSHALLMHHKS